MILGVQVINWELRKQALFGMDGNGKDMTAKQALKIYDEESAKPNQEVNILIFWDDVNQLCCQDRAGLVEELDQDYLDDEGDDE